MFELNNLILIKEKRLLIIFVLILIGIMFCFCANEGSIEEVDVDKDLYGYATVTTSETISRLDMIKSRGKLIAGVKYNSPPFGYIENNENVGFDVELLKYIADELRVDIEFIQVETATRIQAVKDGEVDIVGAAMTHKIERDEHIDFSMTYFLDGQRLLVKKDAGIKYVADLTGKTVAIAKGSSAERNLKAINKNVNILTVEERPNDFEALRLGKADAVATDQTILLGLKNQADNPDDYIVVGELFSYEPYGFGLPENDSKWRDYVNFTLIKCAKRGDYKKIFEKYFGKGKPYEIDIEWSIELWP